MAKCIFQKYFEKYFYNSFVRTYSFIVSIIWNMELVRSMKRGWL